MLAKTETDLFAIHLKDPKKPDLVSQFFSQYFKYVGENEAPLIYHRWAIITAISALLGRNVYIKFGHSNIYPNIYTFLIGEPGARKSSAITVAKKLIKTTGFNTLSAARTTPEKFICDLEENGIREGGNFSELFILEDEFLDFIGIKNDSFISLLTKLFDTPGDYPYRLKNSTPVVISAPTVQILGGCTHATFSTAFPPEIIATGFLSRLLLVHSEKTKKKITWPTGASLILEAELTERLKHILLFHSGAIAITPAANDAIDMIYKNFKDLDDQRFSHYCSRRHTYLLKLCVIVAAMECSLSLKEHHVIWANTLLASIEDRFSKALGEFGKSKNADVSSKIMNALYETELPMSVTDLWKIVQNDLDSITDLSKIISGLHSAERIIRSGEGFLAKKNLIKALPFVDFDLLDASEIPPGAISQDLE